MTDPRAPFDRPPLGEEALGPDPIAAFRRWLDDTGPDAPPGTGATGLRYPNAVVLATVDGYGRPDARVVLLKDVDERGFVFYTNYRSAKGRQINARPDAALVFHWDLLGRQVRVRGVCERVAKEESDEYFGTRPLGSRVGAWASEQSEPIDGRDRLEARYRELTELHDARGEPVLRPPHWGGYLLVPREIEFWAEAPFRLHDRILYRREDGGPWTTVRLQP